MKPCEEGFANGLRRRDEYVLSQPTAKRRFVGHPGQPARGLSARGVGDLKSAGADPERRDIPLAKCPPGDPLEIVPIGGVVLKVGEIQARMRGKRPVIVLLANLSGCEQDLLGGSSPGTG